MDYSNFRRSTNVEDDRNAPWSPTNIWAYLGMQRGPWDTVTDAAKSLRHPFTPLPRAQFDATPSPPGSMADQIGRNDLISILRANPTVVDLADPSTPNTNPHLPQQQQQPAYAPQGGLLDGLLRSLRSGGQ